MKKILFIGTGAWATALANILMQNKHCVSMYGVDKREIKDLNNQVNTKYFGNLKLCKKPHEVCNNLSKLLKAKPDYIVLAIPSAHIIEVVKQIKRNLKNKPVIINASKGFNLETSNPLSIDVKKELKNNIAGYVSLLGPSFASEVIKHEKTVVNVVSCDKDLALEVAKLFKTSYFKCSYDKNELSTEYCAALKNVMAIASGLTYALHLSINTRAIIFTQALKEIYAILNKKHLSTEVLSNFCGVGDIFLTCTDQLSRNFMFGQSVAKYGAKKAIATAKNTIEGIHALKMAKAIVTKLNISKSPVICSLYDVIYNNKNPKTFIKQVTDRIIE